MSYESFFASRVYAITGGASGIGLATARLLLQYGACVSIADISVRPAEELFPADGELARVLVVKVDVRSRQDVDSWIADTVRAFGRLDGAANLAGTIPRDHNVGGVEDMDDEQWRFVMDVNVYGVMNCMRAQLRVLGKANAGAGAGETVQGKADSEGEPEAKGDAGGCRKGSHYSIVNAGSGLSLSGREFTSAYTTSKHAVLGLTRCAAKEVGKRGVRVNCIAPGGTDTPLMRQSMAISEGSASAEDFSTTALGRLAQPSEIADAVVYLLSDKASFVTGTCFSVDGGWAC